MSEGRSVGTIKVLKTGFGFVNDGGPKDTFFHAKQLNGIEFSALKVGTTLTFDLEQGPRGPYAVDVRLVA